MQNTSNERWRSPQAVSPNNKLNKTSRSMPQWLQARGSVLPPPPPPPTQADLTNHVDPDYEVIEFSNNQAYINAPTIMNHGKGKEGRRCDLCGSSAPSVKCDKCAQQNFCYSCDDMYHRHPKRQSHIRKPLEPSKANFRPPLPPKGESSSAPVPPPRRNKRMSRTSTPGPPEQGFKKDGSLMGSLRRMMGTRPLPPTPTLISRDPRQDKMMEFQDHQPPSRDSGYLDWELDSRLRSGSLTALNAPNFAPLMHAQSMAQLNCPSCQHHGMVWDWNHQHMAGGFNRPAWNGLPTGTWHGSAMIPQFKQESSMDGLRRNSLRPRRSRRDLASDMSGEEDETFFRRRHTSPARSRRGMVSDFDDSDDDDLVSHKSGRRSRRRASPTRNVSPALSRKSSGRKMSVEEMINQRLRKNDEESFSSKGRNYDDHDTVSLRGGRRTDDHDTVSLRGGRRTDDEVSSNRGGRRYQDDEVASNHGRSRRYDDETMSQRGGRRSSNVLDDTHSNRGGRRNSEIRRRRNKSPEPKSHAPPVRREPSSEDSGDELSDENKQSRMTTNKNGEVEKEVVKSTEETNGKESANETEEPLGPVPTQQWECDHCTFVNRAGTRVCTVCCKTTAKPKYVEEKKKATPAEAATKTKPLPPKQNSITEVDLVKRMDDLSFSDNTHDKETAQETEEEKRRKKKGADHDIPDVKEKVVASTGTSPPPQSISTQTYDILRPKLRRAASLADHDLWAAPQRSVSRQSLTSDSQSLPLTPSRSQSPGAESLPSWGDLHLKRDAAAREQPWGDLQSENGNVRNNFQMTRRPSEPALNSRAVVRRAGSQPPEYFNTLVQKQMKQGLEMVKLLREAEDNQFSADELGIALNQCGEGNPVTWLVNNWRNMVDTVVTLATNYGHERKENTVGTISVAEAKEALITHNGNVWAAVTECIEQRQKKYADLMSRGNFTREDIVTVLTANHGNLESAFLELNKNQLKPFLMRIWGPPQGTDNDSGNIIGLQQTDGTEFVEKAKSIERQGSNTSDEVSDDNNSNEAPRYSQVKSWLETTQDSDKDSDRVEMNVLEQQLRKVSLPGDEEYVGTMLLKSIPHKPTNQQLIELAKQQNKWKSESQLLHYYDNEEFISNRKRKKKLREEKSKTVYTDTLGDTNVIERLILDGNIQQVTRHLEDQYRFDDEVPNDIIQDQIKKTVLNNANHKRNERPREVINDTNLPFVNLNELASRLNLKPAALEDQEFQEKKLNNLLKTYSYDDQGRNSSSEELAIQPQNIRPTIYNAVTNVSISPESLNRSEDDTIKSVDNNFDYAQFDNISEPEVVTSSKLIVALDKGMIDKIKSDQKSANSSVSDDNSQMNNNRNPQKGNNPLKRSSSMDIKVSTLQIQINGSPNNNNKKISLPESVQRNNISNDTTGSDRNVTDAKQESTRSEVQEIDRKQHNDDVELIPEVVSKDPTNGKYFEEIFVRTVNSSENDTKADDNEDEDTEEFLDTLQSPIGDIADINNIIEESVEEPIVPVNVNQTIIITQDLDKNEASDESNLYSFPNNDVTPISSPSTPISERLLESYSSNSSQKTSSSIAESRAEILDLLKASLSDDQVLDRIVFSLFSNVLGDRTTPTQTKVDVYSRDSKSFDSSKSPLPTKRLSISSESEINAESEFYEAEEEVESVPVQTAPVTVLPQSTLHDSKDQVSGLSNVNNKGVASDQGEIEVQPTLISIEKEITPITRDVTLERLKDIVENTVVFKDTNPSSAKNSLERNYNTEKLKLNTGNRTQNTTDEKGSRNEDAEAPVIQVQATHTTDVQSNIGRAEEAATEELETEEEEEEEIEEEEVEEVEEEIEEEPIEESEVEEENLEEAENDQSSIKENLVVEIEKLENLNNREGETNYKEGENSPIGEVANQNLDDSTTTNDPILNRERQARRYLAEGFVETYDQAELAVQLMELEFERELSLSTAKECSSLPAALALLQQECQLCAEKYTMKQMISMLECEHFCCLGCATHYFTLQITERNINDCVCPFCKQPNLDSCDGDQALNYFSNLDIQLKGFLEPAVHELFQRKLRDRTLMQDPNFKWCAKCSSGFIANPRQRRLVCPDCRSITCASCRKPWEKQHEGVSCAEYAAWLEKNDPENQIDQHLAEHGVTCPKCMARYSLSRGGCMHLTCPHCKHEFCSGCANPFLMGTKCTVSEYCAKLGLHAHHPRNCLFYLRDKEPQLLQKLLDDNNVEYKKDLPEKEGARCTMQLQRETPDGMIDVTCSQPVIFSGLCRTHYIEYLVKQIGQQKLDPIAILDLNEAQQELRRRGKALPERPSHLTDDDYLKLCAKIVKEEIPLE